MSACSCDVFKFCAVTLLVFCSRFFLCVCLCSLCVCLCSRARRPDINGCGVRTVVAVRASKLGVQIPITGWSAIVLIQAIVWHDDSYMYIGHD